MRLLVSAALVALLLAASLATTSDGAAKPGKGVGPVRDVKLGPLDSALARKGRQVFEEKCAACHKLDERYVGPALGGVTKRRAPEWIMNMILNPQEMTTKDPTAQELLGEYMTQMTLQNVTQADARAILEFVRTVDRGQKGEPAKDEKHKDERKKQ